MIRLVDGVPVEMTLEEVAEIEAGWSIPPTPVNLPLKKWQFFAMVDYLGVADAIETAIGSIEDPMQRAVVRSRYLNSDIYNRDDPLFDQIAAQIGLSLEDLDAAWLTIAAPE